MNQQITRVPLADADRQRDLCQKLHERFAARSPASLVLVNTCSCQQNEADSERLRSYLSKMGYQSTQSKVEADLAVINTCTIRKHTEMRMLGNVDVLTHTKRTKPGQLVYVCDCMAQEPRMAQKIKDSYRQVDLVFGLYVLWRFSGLLYHLVTRWGYIFDIVDEPGSIVEGVPLVRQEGVKAWVSTMYGCNSSYTYRTVPYVRGWERSWRSGITLDKIRGLVAEGYKGITLLDQNVNSYGKSLDEPVDFVDLLKVASELPGDFLLRFMTGHPKDASQKLFDTVAFSPEIASCFHLPFQAGSDRTLRAMNRVYDRTGYLGKVYRLRQAIPDVVITFNMIVGFPGETAEELENTITLIDEMHSDTLFTSIFSPREGTSATEMDDPIPKMEKATHFQQLVERQGQTSEGKHAAYIGKTTRCPVDEKGDKGLTARTPGDRLVCLTGGESLIGQSVNAKVTEASKRSPSGEPA